MAAIIDGVYELGEKIGTGGMAYVFKAEVDLEKFDYHTLYAFTQVQAETHHERRMKAEVLAGAMTDIGMDGAAMRRFLDSEKIPIPGEVVALKMSRSDVEAERFEAEWKNLLCLNHPNVIKVFGGGFHESRPYYSMELLGNIVGSDRLRNEFTIRQKLELLIQGGAGLQYLHARGIIHRDIKPDNMVTCEVAPGVLVTKITDLGLAKDLANDTGMTMTNTVMGSPNYMPPEQFESTKNVDHRADIYSLGASLYEFATGIKPYHDKTTVYQFMSAVAMGERPLDPTKHEGNLPPPILEIIQRSMAWTPEERYQSVEEMCRDIKAYLEGEDSVVVESLSFVSQNLRRAAAAPSPKASPSSQTTGTRNKKRRKKKRAVTGSLGNRPVDVGPAPKKKSVAMPLIIAALTVLGVGLLGILGFIAHSASRRTAPQQPVAAAQNPPPTQPVKPKPAVVRPPVKPPPVIKPPKPQPRPSLKSPAEIFAAFKKSNPKYTRNPAKDFSVKNGKIHVANINSPNVVDISSLRGCALTYLNLWHSNVSDISAVNGMPLTFLELESTRVTDLSALRGMPLQQLNISGTPVSDISHLKGLPLKRLDMNGAKVKDLTPLRGMKIERLDINGLRIRNIDALSGMPLKWLSAGVNHMTDIDALKGMPLEVLILEYAKELRSLEPIRGAPLKVLNIHGCYALSDISPLAGMSLETLAFDPQHVRKGMDVLRSIRTLKKINGVPVAEFWAKRTAATPVTRPAEAVWQSIFNGRDLKGWRRENRGTVRVVSGAMEISAQVDMNYPVKWSEFDLEFEFKHISSNATPVLGLRLGNAGNSRGSTSRANMVFHRDGDLDLWWGKGKKHKTRQAYPNKNWLKVRCEVRRDTLKVYSNGKLKTTIDISESAGHRGGLLIYAFGKHVTQLRSIKARPLDAKAGKPAVPGWQSLFNGKDTKGWWWDRRGGFSVKDGALALSNDADAFCTGKWDDFLFECDVKTIGGKGGQVFGIQLAQPSAKKSRGGDYRFRLVLHYSGDIHVYERSGNLKRVWKQGPCFRTGTHSTPTSTWRRVQIEHTRTRLKIHYAGKKVGEWDVSKVPQSAGGICLYCQGKREAHVKNVRVRAL